MFRRYRIALNRDILNQHFTCAGGNKWEFIMFFNNIKMYISISRHGYAPPSETKILTTGNIILSMRQKFLK